MTRLRERGEFGLIRRLTAGWPASPDVPLGPGDDAAVLRPEAGRDLVVTTDAFVEGRHWLAEWIPPAALGARLAVANLSDLAAMAARPRWAVVSLGLAAEVESDWVEALQSGLRAALDRDGARLVGGNVAAVDGAAWASLTLIGDCLPGRAWTRTGARPGDLLAITGAPGRAGAAIALIRALGAGAEAPPWRPLVEAWRAPASRVDLARALAASGAITAAVDVSDGLAGDLAHLCEASGVGAELERSALPVDPALEAAARALGRTADAAGRIELLHRLAETAPYRVTASPAEARVFWERAFPVPLLKVKLNGEAVLMALDLGTSDLIVDPMWASRARLTMLPGQSQVFWCGSRLAVRHALVARLDLGGARVEQVPAGVASLRKWSVEANPQGEQVAGVIGINLLRRFTPTIDFKRQRLELRPLATDAQTVAGAGVSRVPFELWGENEMMVRGTIGAGRKLAMVVQTAYPACGVAAPNEVFQEMGVKPGAVGRALKGTGAWLPGHALAPVTVPAVSVGPVARSHLPGWSDGMDAAEMWRQGVRRDAVLAQLFFGDARVTIDWSRLELLVEP